MAFRVINECLRRNSWGDRIYNKVDIVKKELDDFIDTLNNEQFEKLDEIF